MSDKLRKLLPYEYDLIDALGVSKEDYLDFIAIQKAYKDDKERTVLDVRNGPALPTVAIVLTIVGIILQVVGMLLMRPEEEQKTGGDAANRDERFSPRFGFGSIQEVAKYGEPVNLIYANKTPRGEDKYGNPNGGVRVKTSLLWSAVQSYGSSQFIQMLLVIGAGGIGKIDPEKFALGDTPFENIVSQNYWIYFKENKIGTLSNRDFLPNSFDPLQDQDNGNDPTKAGPPGANPYRVRGDGKMDRLNGFSQAYSPRSANNFGITGPVPINVLIRMRLASGSLRYNNGNLAASPNRINIYGLPAWSADQSISLAGKLVKISKGDAITLRIDKTGDATDRTVAFQEAQEQRRALASVFDNASLFKLGSAIFSVTDINNSNTDEGPVAVQLRCIRGGHGPSSSYNDTSPGVDSSQIANNFFYTKAIVRYTEASYETTNPCNIIDFSIKARVYKVISGRQSVYGLRRIETNYTSADNGTKARSAAFLIKYKKKDDSDYSYIPGIFVVSRASQSDNFLNLRFNSGTTGLDNADSWRFVFQPVYDFQAEYIAHPELKFGDRYKVHYLQNSGKIETVKLPGSPFIQFTGTSVSDANGFPRNNNPALINEWDIFSSISDTQIQFSFDQQPEFGLLAVTEHVVEATDKDFDKLYPHLYENLALVGVNLYSGRTIQSIDSFSLFVEKGRKTRLLKTSESPPASDGKKFGDEGYPYLPSEANGYANNAPDIFIDTVVDQQDGIGSYASIFSVDLKQLGISKLFCQKNKLFMDGVVADTSSWRQFWSLNAGFSLLEFAKIGGRESLVPAVPYEQNTGKITTAIKISALFNPGNILEGSHKEEFLDYGSGTQDVIVTCIYRDTETDNTFVRNTSVEVKLSDTDEATAVRETIDMSQFVTRKKQAIVVAKYLCQMKRNSRRAVEFKTFPTNSPIEPGAYIYVETSFNEWNNIYTGIIEEGGVLNFPAGSTGSNTTTLINGTYTVLCYSPENLGTVYKSNILVKDNTAETLAGQKGKLFVLGTNVKNKRVFRVTEVSMDEEGEVTVRGVEHATDGDGNSLISKGLAYLVPGLFTIDRKEESGEYFPSSFSPGVSYALLED